MRSVGRPAHAGLEVTHLTRCSFAKKEAAQRDTASAVDDGCLLSASDFAPLNMGKEKKKASLVGVLS